MEIEQAHTQIYNHRWQSLASAMHANHLDALALNPGPSLVYLTGLHFHLSERPVLFIYIPGSDSILILPELELAKTKALPYSLRLFPYGEDPDSWQKVIRQAILSAGASLKKVGVEPLKIRLLEYSFLINANSDAAFIPAGHVLAKLRMHKDSNELDAMRRAVEIAQNALKATIPVVRIGITERELAAELTLQLLRNGSDGEIPFAPIVSSGPNSANPHATPSDRSLREGDLLVIDWGASHHGYFSDITRTFAIGEIGEKEKQISQVVLLANTTGREAVCPGVHASTIDMATRNVIDSAGFGRYFTHRTGHGLGMEGHEEPYIRSGNDLIIAPGMTFTIEPGIYLPDRNGVRIEDDVVVTAKGMESLTTYPREVVRLI